MAIRGRGQKLQSRKSKLSEGRIRATKVSETVAKSLSDQKGQAPHPTTIPLVAPIPQELKDIVDVSEEILGDDKIIKQIINIATKNNAVILAFIAPYSSERISPIERRWASIGISEEFGIEIALKQIRHKAARIKKLYLLINSEGGLLSSSFKIANFLRDSFEEITIFVPHIAASGGTLLTFAGNKIVMGAMANLTPIDVQMSYKGTRVSANTITYALNRLEAYFKTILPDEAPYPRKRMAESIDPIILEDWSAATNEIWYYAKELLKKSGYDNQNTLKILINFVMTDYTHNFVIGKDKAKEFQLNISEDRVLLDELDVLDGWILKYIMKSSSKHFIRYILPSNIQQSLLK